MPYRNEIFEPSFWDYIAQAMPGGMDIAERVRRDHEEKKRLQWQTGMDLADRGINPAELHGGKFENPGLSALGQGLGYLAKGQSIGEFPEQEKRRLIGLAEKGTSVPLPGGGAATIPGSVFAGNFTSRQQHLTGIDPLEPLRQAGERAQLSAIPLTVEDQKRTLDIRHRYQTDPYKVSDEEARLAGLTPPSELRQKHLQGVREASTDALSVYVSAELSKKPGLGGKRPYPDIEKIGRDAVHAWLTTDPAVKQLGVTPADEEAMRVHAIDIARERITGEAMQDLDRRYKESQISANYALANRRGGALKPITGAPLRDLQKLDHFIDLAQQAKTAFEDPGANNATGWWANHVAPILGQFTGKRTGMMSPAAQNARGLAGVMGITGDVMVTGSGRAAVRVVELLQKTAMPDIGQAVDINRQRIDNMLTAAQKGREMMLSDLEANGIDVSRLRMENTDAAKKQADGAAGILSVLRKGSANKDDKLLTSAEYTALRKQYSDEEIIGMGYVPPKGIGAETRIVPAGGKVARVLDEYNRNRSPR